MHLLDKLPPGIESTARSRLPAGAEIVLALPADMGPHGQFGQTWLVASRDRLLVIPPAEDATAEGDGEAWFPPGMQEIEFRHVEAVRSHARVGCWRLDLVTGQGTRPLVYYTGHVAPRMGEAALALTQLARKGEFTASPVVDETTCPTCHRPLAETGGTCPRCFNKRRTLRRLLGYLWPHKGLAALLAVTAIVHTAPAVVPPYLIKMLVDDVLVAGAELGVGQRVTMLLWLVGGMVGVRLVMLGGEIVHRVVSPRLAWRITADLRSDLFRHLEAMSFSFYDRRQVGSIMSRVTHDCTTVQHFLTEGVPFLVNNAVLLVVILTLLFLMHPLLAALVVLPAPLLVLIGFLSWKRMRWLFHRWWIRWASFSGYLNEALTGIRVTKAFSQEPRQIESFERQNAALADAGIRVERTLGIIMPSINFLLTCGSFVVWGVGGYFIIQGSATVGDLVFFIFLLMLFHAPMQYFAQFYHWTSRALTGAERIFDILRMRPETSDGQARPLPRPVEGRVALEHVYFGYDKAKPVLHDVTLEAAPGEMIGLVGKSGAGKSTVIKLLCRFYQPDSGRITVDGVDLATARLDDLREQIGLVPQEPFLFAGTIAENIAFGRPDASLDQIVRAAQAANAHEFICLKPDGYDSRVGEAGKQLSTGERQRLSIARAVLRDPRILVLDEATSSVDTETERLIQEALERLIRGRTTFAIAHRLSTLRNADRLVVLEEGRVVEVGSHDELMRKPDGTFARLVRMQQEINRIVEVAL